MCLKKFAISIRNIKIHQSSSDRSSVISAYSTGRRRRSSGTEPRHSAPRLVWSRSASTPDTDQLSSPIKIPIRIVIMTILIQMTCCLGILIW